MIPSIANGAKIVASSNHIASIISIIDPDVEVIASNSSCPTHYSMKPSDIEKIESADIIVYIDDKFEPFSKIIKERAKGKIIQISNLENIDIRKNNFHIWLDTSFAKELIKAIGDEAGISTASALRELDRLQEDKIKAFSKVGNPVFLSDSLEYLYYDSDRQPLKLYSLRKSISLISKLESLEGSYTIFADSSDNFDSIIEKTGRKIIYIDSEKWPKSGYISYYRNILAKIE